MNRYQNLFDALNEIRQRRTKLRLLEVGTYDGVRASHLLKTWIDGGPTFTAEYYGFDLFEDMTKELTAAELSKSRLPPSRSEAQKRIAASVKGGAVGLVLHKGNTRETLHKECPSYSPMDLIFIDGGHSLETIASDWDAVKQLMDKDTIVLFDDYYDNREDFGCRHEIGRIGEIEKFPIVGDATFVPKYKVELLDPMDRFDHTNLDVRMVKVTLNT